MGDLTDVRVTEKTEYGDWPWRYVVEGLTASRMRKRWPWSKEATVPVPPKWAQLPHGVRGYAPCQWSDANALAAHYRARLQPQGGR